MTWWDELWKWANESQLGAAVVGGLIVAAVVGVVALIPKLRKPSWEAIKRAWAFLWTIRLTTTTRIEAAKAAALKELEQPKKAYEYRLVPMDEFNAMQQAKENAEAEAKTAAEHSAASAAAVLKAMEKSRENQRLLDETLAKARESRKKLIGSGDEAPPIRPREPVSWSVRKRGSTEIVLTNLSNTDSAFHVETSSGGLHAVVGETAWSEVHPKQTVRFHAGRDPEWPFDPMLTVVWEDRDGRAEQAHLDIIGI